MFGSSSPAAPAPPPSDDTSPSSSTPAHTSPCSETPNTNKRKRRPAGTPDPDAEVVSLSPRTLLESDRYVCDICNQGFQREQNLQMHRRRHKVPWRLLKREGPAAEARKRVFVCPEPSCLHHHPGHALGDLVGIKKHFRRKHSDNRQWACVRCSKAYAVLSDYKAHLKTCGTRGHSCDCGRVFSRVESFIEHQDTCNAGRARARPQMPRTTSNPDPSSDTNLTTLAPSTWPCLRIPATTPHNLELQLLPASEPDPSTHTPVSDDANTTRLHLSIRPDDNRTPTEDPMEQLRVVIEEKAMADEERRQAHMNVEQAELEFANAKRIRQQARAELDKAHVLRDEVAKQVSSILVHITCHDCRQKLSDDKVVGEGETKISGTCIKQ